jgi:hypothetical protein
VSARSAARSAALAVVVAGALAAPAALDPREPADGARALGPHAGALVRALPARPALATDQVAVSRAPGVQAEVAVAADPSNPDVLVAGSGTFEPGMRVYSTMDGGATWASDSLPRPGALCGYGDPAVAVGEEGRQFYAFLAGRCDDRTPTRVSLALATRAGAAAEWTTRQLSIEGAASFNDKEALAVDTSPASPHRGRLYLSWSRLWIPTGAFEVVVSHSDDDGVTWSPAARVSGSGGSSQTFSSLAVGGDGTLYVAWLTFDRVIKLDRSTDGGDHFGTDVQVGYLSQHPSVLCRAAGTVVAAQAKRCVVPAPLVSVDPARGRVYVTFGAAGTTGREQNVYVSAYDAATLRPLLTRRRINPPDAKAPSDQFMPASAVDASGVLWACWYDTTGDAARKRVRYRCSASSDGGATWTPPQWAATAFSDETRRAAASFQYGDYAGLAVAGGRAHPIWTDSRDLASLGEEIYTTTLGLELP